jgi:hypothetical protein
LSIETSLGWNKLAKKITDGLVEAENNSFGKSNTDAVFSVLWELNKQIPVDKSVAIEANFKTVSANRRRWRLQNYDDGHFCGLPRGSCGSAALSFSAAGRGVTSSRKSRV